MPPRRSAAGTAWALAGMAFLAVLKEGFETSVFLLATFQASSDTGLAALGAVIGIAAAVVVGYGIYTGGVRLNLSRSSSPAPASSWSSSPAAWS